MVMDKSFTFHDGLSLPAGTLITFPIQAILNDEKHYDNPTQFDAYRFFKMRNSSAEDEGNEYQWAASTASPTNLA
jgi:cytochrome P450